VIVEESNLPSQVHAIPRELAQAPSAGSKRSPSAAIVGPVRAAGDALRTVEAGQSNLPQALTSFIGRERDLVEIKRLLPSKRLITVVGTGGIGKTRLALQTAVEVTSAYRDAVCFIDLSPLRDAALVPAAVARAFPVQPPRLEKGHKSR
jgi:Flp pilus assembly CpaE family ATPase